MLLHLLPDDKFITTFCRMATEVALANVHQLFVVRDAKPYKYLPEDAPYLINAPFDSPEFTELTGKMGKGDRIIIHFLHPAAIAWLENFETEASIEWVFWSGDFYTWAYYNFQEYDALTDAYLKAWYNSPLSRFKALHWYRKYKRSQKEKADEREFNKKRDKAISKISVFHHYVREEYDLVCKMIPLKARFNHFCYTQDMSFDDIYTQSQKLESNNSPLNVDETNLMVGHSGYAYVNHLDSIDFLKDKLSPNVNVVVPLSYGDKAYIDHVTEVSGGAFGTRFVPITKYMSFEEYLIVLKSCDALFLSLNTAKAMGNLHTLLLLGKRIFIKREMLAYAYFERIGIKVNTHEEFSEELLRQPEKEDVVQNNIDIILDIHSLAKHYKYTNNLVNLS